jgi:phospholipase C
MMENHSYDNYFGMLPARGEAFRLNLAGEPVAANLRANGESVAAHHATATVQAAHVPTQSWHATHMQWNDGGCDGFVRSIEVAEPTLDAATAMGYWSEADLPFYYGLARTFPVADRWFCSCLGPTFPNRRFLIAGTAHGLIDDLPFGMVDYPPNGTIFDMLAEHDISWANYHNVSKTKLAVKRSLGAPGLTMLRRIISLFHWFPPLVKAVQGDISCTADLYPLGLARCMLHLKSTDQFFKDADNGTLPAFSIVDPDFGAYSEENPQDISNGESFAAEVINRVMNGKGWPHTLLIWLYDEHGGYYDHVPPPAAPPPDDVQGQSLLSMRPWLRAMLRPFFKTYIAKIDAIDEGPHRYDRYGFRVPAVIVSPYAKSDYVCSEVLDHTSVLKLIEQKWNLPPLTRRDAEAASPIDALDLGKPPAFLTPPVLPASRIKWPPP